MLCVLLAAQNYKSLLICLKVFRPKLERNVIVVRYLFSRLIGSRIFGLMASRITNVRQKTPNTACSGRCACVSLRAWFCGGQVYPRNLRQSFIRLDLTKKNRRPPCASARQPLPSIALSKYFTIHPDCVDVIVFHPSCGNEIKCRSIRICCRLDLIDVW